MAVVPGRKVPEHERAPGLYRPGAPEDRLCQRSALQATGEKGR
ncbi:hypothetical protein B005_0083 [Nocardiopsis alba ATCC BAA-2165]|uniref:Uncharacterized protein n=1 Tax=Nocardiopsis alba (strain ATCC BAA-2165 / BE74) TaxID=1205910 RepID=J7KYY5_NOCAA|nr:hypothetical protein B005_0083 [Nocardiopsis alba ATCC BAA-2165]